MPVKLADRFSAAMTSGSVFHAFNGDDQRAAMIDFAFQYPDFWQIYPVSPPNIWGLHANSQRSKAIWGMDVIFVQSDVSFDTVFVATRIQ